MITLRLEPLLTPSLSTKLEKQTFYPLSYHQIFYILIINSLKTWFNDIWLSLWNICYLNICWSENRSEVWWICWPPHKEKLMKTQLSLLETFLLQLLLHWGRTLKNIDVKSTRLLIGICSHPFSHCTVTVQSPCAVQENTHTKVGNLFPRTQVGTYFEYRRKHQVRGDL